MDIWENQRLHSRKHSHLFQQAGRELVNEGLLVIDEDTEEALLLDHIDLTADSGTIESAYLGTASPRLRRILVSELNRTLRQGKHFPFEWEEIHDIRREPNADSDEYEEPHPSVEPVEDDSLNTSQTDNSTSKKEKEPVQQDDTETSSVEPVETEDKPVGKRRGRHARIHSLRKEKTSRSVVVVAHASTNPNRSS